MKQSEMVRISGTQNIPSALFALYKRTLTEQGNNPFCKKRSPFRLPNMQTGGVHVREAQLIQRARFLKAVALFDKTGPATRARWYDRMPEWSSLLWYYNYYIMAALSAGTGPDGRIEGMINSIQYISGEVPVTGTKEFAIDTVDPSRTVVMIFGNSYIADTVQRGNETVLDNDTVTIPLSPSINPAIAEVRLQGQKGKADPGGEGDWLSPYVDSLSATQLVVALPLGAFVQSCTFSWEVVERKSQPVFPLPIDVAAAIVTVDWSSVPSAPADVALIVVEYI